MGTWANDPFGNDTACDWEATLISKSRAWSFRNEGFIFIKVTLEKVLSAREEYLYLEASDADEGVAAADTVARLRGHFYECNAYTSDLDQWVAAQKKPIPQELVDLALRAVNRVTSTPSELLDLWEESGEADAWKEQMAALKERLKQPAQPI